jgi:hypothetical protein
MLLSVIVLENKTSAILADACGSILKMKDWMEDSDTVDDWIAIRNINLQPFPLECRLSAFLPRLIILQLDKTLQWLYR